MTKPFVFIFFFLLFSSYRLLSPPHLSAQSCGCRQVGYDPTRGAIYKCSAGCDFEGADCTTADPSACTASSVSKCSQLPNKTWVEVFRACVDFGEAIGAIMNIMIVISGALAVIRLIAGGLAYIYSAGNPTSLENAMGTMTSAIFGLMLVLFAYLFMRIVQGAIPERWELWLLGKP